MSEFVSPGRLLLTGPGWSRDLTDRADELKVVQFTSPPPDSELEQIGFFIERHPGVQLRVYGGSGGSIKDLEFLRHFRAARHVSIGAFSSPLESIDGLRHLNPDLESLVLERSKRRFSLKLLKRFTGLRDLTLEGHGKDIGAVCELKELRSLMLISIPLQNLDLLRPLLKLRSLSLKLGAIDSLGPLGEFQALEYLELWRVRGLSDLSEISGLSQLRYLLLQALKNVTELPDLSRCLKLQRIHLETMKGLTNLEPLRTAPALHDLLMVDMPQLRWEHVEALRDHPSLKRLHLGTGSSKRNAELSERLGYEKTESPSEGLLELRRSTAL